MSLLGTVVPQTSSYASRGPGDTWGWPVVAADAVLTSTIAYRYSSVGTLRISCPFNAGSPESETSRWLAYTQDPIRGA